METESFSFRTETKIGNKIKKEAYEQRLPAGTYLRQLIEDLMQEPEDTRNQMIEHHHQLTEAVYTLSEIILNTEKHLRSFDFEMGSAGLMEKFLAEMRVKVGRK